MLRDSLGVEAMQGADQGGQAIGGEVEVALEPGGEGSGGELGGGDGARSWVRVQQIVRLGGL